MKILAPALGTLLIALTAASCSDERHKSKVAAGEKMAHGDHAMNSNKGGGHEVEMAEPSLSLAALPDGKFAAGKTMRIGLTLSRRADGRPVSFADLAVAHTKKLHLLIIDASLSDYQHIHPEEGATAGDYSFLFTPKTNKGYRIWADVLPVATRKQEYVRTNLGSASAAIGDRTENIRATVDGYVFALDWVSPPTAGQQATGTVTVTKDGASFAGLEPIMGAFAHIVAFPEDLESVLHVHPMGKEPKRESERGGPALQFHLETGKPGFVKLFAQVRIGDKDLFAPFGVRVK